MATKAQMAETIKKQRNQIIDLGRDFVEMRQSCSGGHYCCTEWDGMWIHRGMTEWDCCLCEGYGKGEDSLPTQIMVLKGEAPWQKEGEG